jgi:ketosteroid isomerase-like protein
MPYDHQEVLAANAAFYAAFAERDVEAMEAVWSRSDSIACVHPGWRALHGRESVMATWRSILEGEGAPDITFSNARAYVNGTSAFVICIERLPGGSLVSTNLFSREDGEWRMVHHHTGPAPPEIDELSSDLLN